MKKQEMLSVPHYVSNRRTKNRSNTKFIVWSIIVVAVLVLCVIAPVFATHDPYAIDMQGVYSHPDHEHIMGTDYLGRCVACRLLHGASRSVFAAIIVVGITFVAGTTIGVISGYFGGKFDTFIMRFVDCIQAFPSLIFTIAIAATLGGGFWNCIIAMSLTHWVEYARLARTQTLTVRSKSYIDAARITGMPKSFILFKTIVPNCMPTLVITASLEIGNTLLGFSGLSFLGLGSAPPFPEWGGMLSAAKEAMQISPGGVLFPGMAILIVVMIMGMFADAVNEKLDPKKYE